MKSSKTTQEKRKSVFFGAKKAYLSILSVICILALCTAIFTGCDSQAGPQGEPGVNGVDGVNGQDGKDGVNGQDGKDGEDGKDGQNGADGISAYVGYDGYIWNGDKKTEFKANATLPENVVENTIGIEGVMSKYFEGSYVDLSSNTIALMSNYMSNAKLTRYSDAHVFEISVISENAGTLYVGTAKVNDVVTARTEGTTYTANTTSYTLNAGLNRITLDINVAEDETIVLGGNGSTAKLYVAAGIPNNDEEGNFALINGQANTDVISNNGAYADTLAVQVKATFISEETELTPDALDFVRTTEVADTAALPTTNHGLVFTNNFFKNSQITEIGLPIKAAKTIGASGEAEAFFTVSVVKYGTTPVEIVSTYKVAIPYEKLKDVATYNSSSSNYTVDKWIHIDVTDLNIVLGEDETLAFLDSNDPITYGYERTDETTSTHNFAYTLISAPDWNKAATKNHVAFDVYGKKPGITIQQQIEKLEKKNTEAILANALQNKNISILGDSISSYVNWSNNTNYNSTLESNGTTAYDGTRHGVANVNQTWWKQAIDQTGMNLLVDNAKSGARVAESLDRAKQLHSDVGDDAGTNPDIIAVWIGINDVRYGATVSAFAEAYRAAVQSITTQYNADVYLFTLIPQKDHEKATDAMIKQINAEIIKIAAEFDCTVVDLYNDSGINLTNSGTYMYDYLHPNTKGMDLVTECFLEALYENYVTNAE